MIVLLIAAGLIQMSSTGIHASSDGMWVKGSLHAHTTNSDGDADPQVVADWYREHGYDFLVISDHWTVMDVSELDTGGDDFLIISGEESGIKGSPKPIHMNAIGNTELVNTPPPGDTGQSMALLVERIREVGAIPMANHPNFGWSFTHRELLQIHGPYLLEIFNAHPLVNNFGNNAYLPVEQTWDILLSNGQTVYGTVTDDAHNYHEFSPHLANPGRGWVYVKVSELTLEEVLGSLARGDFYASTGVELAEYSFDGDEFSVSVVPKDDQKYLIRFVGKWGAILQETMGTSASYQVIETSEPHSYIRCKVIASDGTVAWTQAHRIGD